MGEIVIIVYYIYIVKILTHEYDIIKDPLLYITVDYDPNCNIIKTNYDQTELIFSNLELTLSSNITTADSYNIFRSFTPCSKCYMVFKYHTIGYRSYNQMNRFSTTSA